MPILKAAIDSLDALGDELCMLDMSRPRHNLTGLGVRHTFEEDGRASFVVRDAESQEAKLVAPGTKGVYEDMLSRIGVQHANLGVDAAGREELDAQAFEEFYDKTVDLADLCQLPDVNERLNQVANSYQEFSIRREELSAELKRLAVIPRIKQRLAKLPQMRRELEESTVQRHEMEAETGELVRTLDAMDKDISYLRMEHSMDQENEEQALAQLGAKRSELERLKAELETKQRVLEARREAYRQRRPLTGVEHSERMLGALERLKEKSEAEETEPEAARRLHGKRSVYTQRLAEIISNSDAIEVTNRYMDKVFANTIDSVANEDVDSLEARRASRRLSMTAATPSGRVLAAQLLCFLYTRSQADQTGMLEDDLRAQISDFARERQWNPDLTVQAMYEVFAKKLAKRFREDRTHMVRLLWD